MDTPQQKTCSLNKAPIVPELRDVVALLLDNAVTVHYFPNSVSPRATWVVVSREGRTGTVQYDQHDGYAVHFAIRPSVETGSSLLVTDAGGDMPQDPYPILAAVLRATQPEYANFATAGQRLPNHGWAHYAWTRERLVLVVADDEAPNEQPG